MRYELQTEILSRLTRDFGFKHKGNWLQEGKCPDCNKREMWAKADAPWRLRCGRESKCGTEIEVKTLYSDLFESWSDRYKASYESPTAAADAYLQFARGLDVARLRGLYSQENYTDSELSISTATVRFALACGSWWERLIDKPQRFGKKKARFAFGKSYAGHWWANPATDLAAEDTLWLVEGIFDACALDQNGVPAVALLSCNNYPEHALAELASARAGNRPTLVWALDSDTAGRNYTRKWVERARADGWDCKAAQIPQAGKAKVDWNDLHQREALDATNLDGYLYEGALLIAQSATEKALLIYHRHGMREFPFEYASRVYWFSLDLAKYDKAASALREADAGLTEDQIREQAMAESGGVSEICDCYPQALYYQANPITDEAWYYYRVTFPHRGKPIKNTFTAAQLASSSEFKKRLLHIAPGAMFIGSTQQLDRLVKRQAHNIKRVETIDFTGYSREHGCYVLGDLAVKDGAIYEVNDEDYFDLGKLAIKSLSQSVSLAINYDRSEYRTDWLPMIWQCYGAKGIVALAFWAGSLYAEQIRALHKSYPFFEIVGEAGSGKSTLIEFLWKLLGRRDYEGFDPSKSTLPARARNFAQVANLPVVLIESDREGGAETGRPVRNFDWDELKTAYNGRSVRARGVKNGGNDTYEPPFRGAIVISQNNPVAASDAVMQRIVHTHFDRTAHTVETKNLAEQLERMPMESVSGFTLAACKREQQVMAMINERTPEYENRLQALPEIKSMRIAKNHAQLMALVDALGMIVKLSEEQRQHAHAEIVAMAVARQQAINADHPVVQAFWDSFDYIDEATVESRLDHSRDANVIAVNLNHYAEVAGIRRHQIPELVDLKRYLRTSRLRKFVDIKSVNSQISGKTVKCWVFQREKQ